MQTKLEKAKAKHEEVSRKLEKQLSESALAYENTISSLESDISEMKTSHEEALAKARKHAKRNSFNKIKLAKSKHEESIKIMETNLANAEKSYNAEVNDLKEEVSKLQALQQQIQETHAQEIDSLRKNREKLSKSCVTSNYTTKKN